MKCTCEMNFGSIKLFSSKILINLCSGIMAFIPAATPTPAAALALAAVAAAIRKIGGATKNVIIPAIVPPIAAAPPVTDPMITVFIVRLLDFSSAHFLQKSLYKLSIACSNTIT